MRDTSPGPRPRLLIWLALPLLAVLPARAADKPARRTAVATCVTETCTLLRREAPDKPWQVVKEGEELFTGDLLMGGAQGAIDTKDGAVRLVVVGDADGTSPIPILETAFVLHEAKGADLAFTLERGRVRLINLKKEGPAVVRLRVRDKQLEFTLVEPGATLSLELFSRWPRGVPFTKEAKPGQEPALLWAVVAVKGEITLKGPNRRLTLQAPPGPALMMGDSLGNPEPAIETLKELPPWCPERLADLVRTEHGKKLIAVVAKFRKQAIEKGVGATMREMLASDDPLERRTAILWAGATDDLEPLADLLKNTKHQDVWDAGIVALRTWIGRGAGQDLLLYKGLMEKGKLSAAEAAGVLDLLHTFGDEDLSRPETYHVLINYLGSERVSLRELAYWHLQRLVPGGAEIGYAPLDPKEKRDAAIKEWRKLVPAGKLPAKKGSE
jgi:hypothetical protein